MTFSRAALALFAAASLPALAAVAQQAQTGGQPQRGPSPEMIERIQDGKLAGAKAMLRLTPEQEKLWGPVEQEIRANFAERSKLRAERFAKRAERRADGERGDDARSKLPLPDRLDKATERMTKRAERLKAFSTAVKPLYASLTDEQKLVANQVLGHLAGGKGGHHHGGWGHHGRHHGGWGGMRAEGGGHGWGHHGRGHHGHKHDMSGPDAGGADPQGQEQAPAGDKGGQR